MPGRSRGITARIVWLAALGLAGLPGPRAPLASRCRSTSSSGAPTPCSSVASRRSAPTTPRRASASAGCERARRARARSSSSLPTRTRLPSRSRGDRGADSGGGSMPSIAALAGRPPTVTVPAACCRRPERKARRRHTSFVPSWPMSDRSSPRTAATVRGPARRRSHAPAAITSVTKLSFASPTVPVTLQQPGVGKMIAVAWNPVGP